MITTLIQVQTDSIVAETVALTETSSLSIWFWVAMVEFILIIFILFRSRKKNDLAFGDISKSKMRNAKKSDIDMDNLMNSINSSKDLYKELSRKCHPDRFINSEKQKAAQAIFQNISKYKRDHSKLLLLKEQAKTELNIEFK